MSPQGFDGEAGTERFELEAQRAAVATWLNGGNWEVIEEVMIKSGKSHRNRPELLGRWMSGYRASASPAAAACPPHHPNRKIWTLCPATALRTSHSRGWLRVS